MAHSACYLGPNCGICQHLPFCALWVWDSALKFATTKSVCLTAPNMCAPVPIPFHDPKVREYRRDGQPSHSRYKSPSTVYIFFLQGSAWIVSSELQLETLLKAKLKLSLTKEKHSSDYVYLGRGGERNIYEKIQAPHSKSLDGDFGRRVSKLYT